MTDLLRVWAKLNRLFTKEQYSLSLSVSLCFALAPCVAVLGGSKYLLVSTALNPSLFGSGRILYLVYTIFNPAVCLENIYG